MTHAQGWGTSTRDLSSSDGGTWALVLPAGTTLGPLGLLGLLGSFSFVGTYPGGSTDPGSGPPPRVEFGLPAGLNLGLPVSWSAVVYAPNADCTAHGHVDLYGAVVCGSLHAKQGIPNP